MMMTSVLFKSKLFAESRREGPRGLAALHCPQRLASVVLVKRVFVLVHRVFVLVHGVFVLVQGVFVLVHRVFVLVHRVFVLVKGVFVLVHMVFVLVKGVFVLVHRVLGLRSSGFWVFVLVTTFLPDTREQLQVSCLLR